MGRAAILDYRGVLEGGGAGIPTLPARPALLALGEEACKRLAQIEPAQIEPVVEEAPIEDRSQSPIAPVTLSSWGTALASKMAEEVSAGKQAAETCEHANVQTCNAHGSCAADTHLVLSRTFCHASRSPRRSISASCPCREEHTRPWLSAPEAQQLVVCVSFWEKTCCGPCKSS